MQMNEKKMTRFLKFYMPAILWASVIFYLSHQPHLQTPNLGFRFADKLAHFGVYAILGYLIVRAVTRNRPEKIIPRNFFGSAILAVLYGASDEFHQSFIRGRACEWSDLIADALGGIAAVIIFLWINKRK